jgi:hypothetical protein
MLGELLPTGGITVAYREEDGKTIYSVSRCSLKDNYCRSKGRLISGGRLDKGIIAGTFESLPKADRNSYVIERILSDQNVI